MIDRQLAQPSQIVAGDARGCLDLDRNLHRADDAPAPRTFKRRFGGGGGGRGRLASADGGGVPGGPPSVHEVAWSRTSWSLSSCSRWSAWSRCGGGRRARGRGAQLAAMVAVAGELAVVADLVVPELVLAVVVVVREAAVPSSPRWWCWSPSAAVTLVVVVAELGVVAVRCHELGGNSRVTAPPSRATAPTLTGDGTTLLGGRRAAAR